MAPGSMWFTGSGLAGGRPVSVGARTAHEEPVSRFDITSRATALVDRRIGRRSFVARSAVTASAVVANPVDLVLRPVSAYAAICSCSGSACDCGSLCCDGYTEFCCTLTGANSCPPGSVIGGWWKVDGSSFCNSGPRYYMDCHQTCGICPCGSGGICSGACNGTSCGCAKGSCGNRKAGCTHFRYGNCANGVKCLGPIVCRVVTCRRPWEIEASCTTASRVDEGTRHHNRPCLHAQAVKPVVGDWSGSGVDGIGVFWNASRRWELRHTASEGEPEITFGFGGAGDIPVVGDWDGDGRDGIGVFRPSTREWLLRNTAAGGGVDLRFGFGGAGDIPVVGDWDGDGRTGIGVFRPSTRTFRLRNVAGGGTPEHTFSFGAAGDLPVVGNWDGIGSDGFGVFRRWSANWLLRNGLGGGGTDLRFEFGPRDLS